MSFKASMSGKTEIDTESALALHATRTSILQCAFNSTFNRGETQMASKTTIWRFTWDEMPKEKVTDKIDRRLITGDRMMLAHV